MPKGYSITPYKDKVVHRLYYTNIVTVDYSTKKITLLANGWESSSHTRKCFNLALQPFGYRVIKRKNVVYVINHSNSNELEYMEGITLDLN